MKKISFVLILCMLLTATSGLASDNFALQDVEAENQMPDGVTYYFADDFENPSPVGTVKSGGKPFWSQVVTDSFIRVTDDNGNKVAEYYNDSARYVYSRLDKRFDIGEKFADLTIEVSMKSTFSDNYLNAEIHVLRGDNTLMRIMSIPLTNYHTELGTWADFKIDVDPINSIYTLYMNGQVVAENVAFTPAPKDTKMYNFRLTSRVSPSNSVFLDNVKLYSRSELVHTTMLYGGTEVNYDLIQPMDTSSNNFASNLKAHPRVLVTDWDEMRRKIKEDPMCAYWYNTLKLRADNLLTTENVEYKYANGRNILSAARTIMQRLYCLAFVYNIENGDERYLRRAMDEMRNAGNFPDWTNVAPIISTELMSGYAIAYDWMYYALSDLEKAEIVDIVKEKILYQAMYSYEGYIDVEIASGITNRTTVANAAILMAAAAFGDEHPNLCQYLYEKAIKHIKPPLSMYTNDGGFPEGSMYWVYSTTYAVLAMATLDSAVDYSYRLDEKARFFEMKGIEATPNYNIYLNGMAERFNFGDSMSGSNSYTPILHWFALKYGVPAYSTYLNSLTMRENLFSENYNLIFSILWYKSDLVGDDIDYPLDHAFVDPSASLITLRSSWTDNNGIYAGMQGGSNKTSHMFFSLGTFVIDAFGKRFIRLPGPSNYSWKFDSHMYYHKRAEGQNTIIANPGEGPDQNPDADAIIERFETHGDEGFGILDMTKTNNAFASAKRGIKLTDDRSRVVLQDEIVLNRESELWWFAHTDGDIQVSEDKKSAIITMGGDRMFAHITHCSEDAEFMIMPALPLETSPKAADETYQDIYKLAINTTAKERFELTVEFIPVAQGEAPAEKFLPITKLEQWGLQDDKEVFENKIGNRAVFMEGSPLAFVGGRRVYIDSSNQDTAPFYKEEELMLPIRFVSEALKGSTSWVAARNAADVSMNGITISTQAGADTVLVEDQVKKLRVPITERNGKLFASARDIAEIFRKSVYFFDGIVILSHKHADYDAQTLADIKRLLGTHIEINGAPFEVLKANKYEYYVPTAEDGKNEIVCNGKTVKADNAAAIINLDGKEYSFYFVEDQYKNIFGTGDAVNTLEVSKAAVVPDEPTWIPVVDVDMSVEDSRYPKSGTIDNVISDELRNRWSAPGIAWISYDLGEVKTIHSFGLATLNGDMRSFKVKFEVSDDNQNWVEVMDTTTSGTTRLFDIFKLNDIKARYFRITGNGDTSGGSYNSYTEVRFYESEKQEQKDRELWHVYFGSDRIEDAPGAVANLKCVGKNSSGQVVEGATFMFESSNTNVAEVDDNGTVYLKDKGEATITVSVHNGFKLIQKTIPVICR